MKLWKTASVLMLGVAVMLTGCTSTGAGAPSGAAPAASEQEQAAQSNGTSEASDAEDTGLVPAGFPEGFTCETITDLIPIFTDGLYLNESQVEGESQFGCTWSDIPLDTLVPVQDDLTTNLDVIVRIDFEDRQSTTFLEGWCAREDITTTAAAGQVFNGGAECGGGTLHDDPDANGLWAWVPYFELDLAVSCNISTACTPEIPSAYTDQAGYEALRAIADALTENLEFVEPVVVSEAESGPDFLRDWAEAGFPAQSAEPEWYCDTWSKSNNQYYDWLIADVRNGFTWSVSDTQISDPDGIYPSFLLEFTGSGDGEATAYRVEMLLESRCIVDIVAYP